MCDNEETASVQLNEGVRATHHCEFPVNVLTTTYPGCFIYIFQETSFERRIRSVELSHVAPLQWLLLGKNGRQAPQSQCPG